MSAPRSLLTHEQATRQVAIFAMTTVIVVGCLCGMVVTLIAIWVARISG